MASVTKHGILFEVLDFSFQSFQAVLTIDLLALYFNCSNNITFHKVAVWTVLNVPDKTIFFRPATFIVIMFKIPKEVCSISGKAYIRAATCGVNHSSVRIGFSYIFSTFLSVLLYLL